jgi:anti-sigma regulatory factor (Ser/Thr protein kinase)
MPPLQRSERPGVLVSIELPAKLENLPRFITPVLAVARSLPLDENRCNDLELALEESLVNIFNHAYPDEQGTARISCRTEKDCLVVGIEDKGVAFSLIDAAAPDLSVDLAARRIGGLGVHLVRSLMDDVRYRREADRNLLELVVCLQKAGVSK